MKVTGLLVVVLLSACHADLQSSVRSDMPTKSNTTSAPESCTEDGQLNCVTTAEFPAVAISDLAIKIVAGQTIAGVTGTAPARPDDCTKDGSVGCVATVTYKAVTPDLDPNKFCADTIVAGKVGTVPCDRIFDTLMTSNAARKYPAKAVNMSTELSKGVDATAGYFLIPDILFSGDGAFNASGTEPERSNQTHSPDSTHWSDGSAKVTCGTTGTLDQRLQDCKTKNAANATWDGKVQGKYGEGVWRLAVRNSTGNEVWRDERTLLLWSDYLGSLYIDRFAGGAWSPAQFNWCVASGNAQANDPSNICNSTTYQNPPAGYSAISLCTEGPGLYTPKGVDVSYMTLDGGSDIITGTAAAQWTPANEDMTIIDAKGNLNLTSSPAVQWRLPTMHDWTAAFVNGVGNVLPSLYLPYSTTVPWIYPPNWTATINSGYVPNAWTYQPTNGYGYYDNNRGTYAAAVRCIGRTIP